MKKIIKLCLIIFWMGLIFFFSSDTADESTKKSDGVIIHTIEAIIRRDLTDSEREKCLKYLVVPVRKGAHFSIYLVLGILILSYASEFGSISNKMILLSVFLSFLYACSDEIHQLFVPGRSGQFSDVIIDTLGAITGIFIYKLIHNKFKKEEIL